MVQSGNTKPLSYRVSTAPTTISDMSQRPPSPVGNKRPIVCLVPVKNERWILDLFLATTSLWADHIIVADQQSDDGSRDIIARHPKAILIENRESRFNEPERQALLIAEARTRFPGAILFALDADEILSPEWVDSQEWALIQNAEPGTQVLMRWANLRPGLRWHSFGRWVLCGFVDDGITPHVGRPIHSPRLPTPANAPAIKCQTIRILHYRSFDPLRMESKHRWYQCWELLNQQNRHPIKQYRFYHSVDSPRLHKLRFFPQRWLQAYAGMGIDLRAPLIEHAYWWDAQILSWFAKHGVLTFRRLAIWDVDWGRMGRSHGATTPVTDPRTWSDRLVHSWLRNTQFMHRFPPVQFIDLLLRYCWGQHQPAAGTMPSTEASHSADKS